MQDKSLHKVCKQCIFLRQRDNAEGRALPGNGDSEALSQRGSWLWQALWRCGPRWRRTLALVQSRKPSGRPYLQKKFQLSFRVILVKLRLISWKIAKNALTCNIRQTRSGLFRTDIVVFALWRALEAILATNSSQNRAGHCYETKLRLCYKIVTFRYSERI